ncbi:MAG: hypothetical protein PHD70_12185, partial [Anaerostipes sp.]|nr:hypothetical protein [Anaerostipes sp.]
HVNFAYVGKYTLLTTEDKHLPQAYRVSVDVDEISSAQVSRCYGIPGETISFQAKNKLENQWDIIR